MADKLMGSLRMRNISQIITERIAQPGAFGEGKIVGMSQSAVSY